MSLAEQLFSMQDSTLSTKAVLEQRHCSLLALQLPVFADAMQFSAQAGGRLVWCEGKETMEDVLGRLWRFQTFADAVEKVAASARRARVKRMVRV